MISNAFRDMPFEQQMHNLEMGCLQLLKQNLGHWAVKLPETLFWVGTGPGRPVPRNFFEGPTDS